MANYEVSQHLIIGHLGACEPWGYVAPVVAAVLTRATGVRHIYLICTYIQGCRRRGRQGDGQVGGDQGGERQDGEEGGLRIQEEEGTSHK